MKIIINSTDGELPSRSEASWVVINSIVDNSYPRDFKGRTIGCVLYLFISTPTLDLTLTIDKNITHGRLFNIIYHEV
jgi:hypothetical protein